MERLIKDLLDFSKMQSGTFSVTKTTEKAVEVITMAIDSVRMQAEGRRQALTLDVPATLPDIACDKHRMAQALSNLLGNAVKFTPEGGAIRVDARVRGDEFVISVSDTGPGIPPEYLPRIFDRYWQAEEARARGLVSDWPSRRASPRLTAEESGLRVRWAREACLASPCLWTEQMKGRRAGGVAKTPLSGGPLHRIG